MDGKTILIIIFIIILLFIIFRYFYVKNFVLSSMTNGETMLTIQPSSLASNNTSSSPSNFTYSIWFYVNDWNYRYGEPKVVFGRMGNLSKPTQGSIDGVNGLDPCPSVVLGPIENNLIISLGCFPNADSPPTTEGGKTVVHNCTVANVPIQKWVNLLLSVYGRTLDVYVDGKLVKTSLLPGVANVNASAPVYVTPLGGFSGWTSKLQYWPNSSNPQEAWNVYSQGYGSQWLSSIFGQYKVQVSVIKNGVQTTSVQV